MRGTLYYFLWRLYIKQQLNLLSVLACPYWRGNTIIMVRNPTCSIEWGAFYKGDFEFDQVYLCIELY